MAGFKKVIADTIICEFCVPQFHIMFGGLFDSWVVLQVKNLVQFDEVVLILPKRVKGVRQ